MHKNPNCRKVKGSHILLVYCGHCKTNIAKYQKKGRGNLLRMHIDRIIKSSFNFTKRLICPNCGEQLGTRINLKRENKAVYKMNRSEFHTREV